MKTFLKNYRKPAFAISKTELSFFIQDDYTTVVSNLYIKKLDQKTKNLFLNGKDLKLNSIAIDDQELNPTRYKLTDEGLYLKKIPDEFKLTTSVYIDPKNNKTLEGLYVSNKIYATQLEAEGFRKLTFFIDRPDVLSRFTTKIIAPKKYNTLLSNGNLIEEGKYDSENNYAIWEDPSLKPCYLFALVVGNLNSLHDVFTTKSGHKVDLFVYATDPQKIAFSLEALKLAMRFDEEKFGLEYELDRYMLVSLPDFNFGAMENKGLNIFNDRCLLANAKTETSNNYLRVADVIAHEYFHNWTGNRISCQSWFDLCYKEGLTTYRDQCFSESITSFVAQRIADIELLKTYQFSEDASYLAHSVRPRSYLQIDNFYTVTVYHKGAEIIRMLALLCQYNSHDFNKILESFLKEKDGCSISIDDFLDYFANVLNVPYFANFRRWYDTKGTPEVTIKSEIKGEQIIFTCTQNKDLCLPILLAIDGKDPETKLMILNQHEQSFTFPLGENKKPVPSLLRQFSAPIKLHYDYRDDDLLYLLQNDTDLTNRYLISNQIIERLVLQDNSALLEKYIDVLAIILLDDKLPLDFKNKILTLPKSTAFLTSARLFDFEKIETVLDKIHNGIATFLGDLLLKLYQSLQNIPNAENKLDYPTISRRNFRNTILGFLGESHPELIQENYQKATEMTEILGSLEAINNINSPLREELFADFYHKWKNDLMVLLNYFELEAKSKLTDINKIKKLAKLSEFQMTNPNCLRALFRNFCQNNLRNFHQKNGDNYYFITDLVRQIDKFNPHAASDLLNIFGNYQKFKAPYKKLMFAAISRLKASHDSLSTNTQEILAKI